MSPSLNIGQQVVKVLSQLTHPLPLILRSSSGFALKEQLFRENELPLRFLLVVAVFQRLQLIL